MRWLSVRNLKLNRFWVRLLVTATPFVVVSLLFFSEVARVSGFNDLTVWTIISMFLWFIACVIWVLMAIAIIISGYRKKTLRGIGSRWLGLAIGGLFLGLGWIFV